MTARLLSLAAAFLARLGLLLVPLAGHRSLAPFVVLAFALVTAWIPLRPLGLPGRYTPQTGGEP